VEISTGGQLNRSLTGSHTVPARGFAGAPTPSGTANGIKGFRTFAFDATCLADNGRMPNGVLTDPFIGWTATPALGPAIGYQHEPADPVIFGRHKPDWFALVFRHANCSRRGDFPYLLPQESPCGKAASLSPNPCRRSSLSLTSRIPSNPPASIATKFRPDFLRPLVVPAMAATRLLFSAAGGSTLCWTTSSATLVGPLRSNTRSGQSPASSFGTAGWLSHSGNNQLQFITVPEAAWQGG
jgi:hypothetical protein